MRNGLAVAAGGFCGCLARYGAGRLLPVDVLGTWWSAWAWGGQLPLGTLAVNLLGCLLLGLLFTFFPPAGKLPQAVRLALGTGFIGAFTTFSTVSMEMVALLQEGQFITAGTYICISVIGGIGCALLGIKLGNGALKHVRKQGRDSRG